MPNQRNFYVQFAYENILQSIIGSAALLCNIHGTLTSRTVFLKMFNEKNKEKYRIGLGDPTAPLN
jgi:hypothetical protein